MTQADGTETELRRVLIVEDDDALRGLAEVALAEFGGLDVVACASGAEALARAPAFRPDLMLLDMQLPDAEGPALAEALRQHPGLEARPAMLLTGRPEVADRRRAGDPSVIGVLAKPFDPLTLAETVRQCWRAWCREEGR